MVCTTERPVSTAASFGITTDIPPFDYLSLENKGYISSRNPTLVENYDLTTPLEWKEREIKSTARVLSLLNLLDIDEAWLYNCGSIADTNLKLDIGFRVKDTLLGFQVKSSSCGLQTHIDKWRYVKLTRPDGSIQGTYPIPGCVWCDENTDTYKLLVALTKWLSIPIGESTAKSLERLKLARKSKFDMNGLRLFRIDSNDIRIWSLLKFVSVNGNTINYLR